MYFSSGGRWLNLNKGEEIMTNIKSNTLIEILNKYPGKEQYILPILQDIQREYNYIPKDVLEALSEHLEIPLSKLYSMATFYKALSLKAKGKYIIKVCDGTACHIRNAPSLIDDIHNILKIKPGETTEDGMFSLETVNCVGACALAPVIVINNKYYGNVNKNKLKEILSEYRGESHEG